MTFKWTKKQARDAGGTPLPLSFYWKRREQILADVKKVDRVDHILKSRLIYPIYAIYFLIDSYKSLLKLYFRNRSTTDRFQPKAKSRSRRLYFLKSRLYLAKSRSIYAIYVEQIAQCQVFIYIEVWIYFCAYIGVRHI